MDTPNITPKDLEELKALSRGPRVTPEFLRCLAEHYLRAEADGVTDPAAYFAKQVHVQRQTVLTYMRMARSRGLIVKDNR